MVDIAMDGINRCEIGFDTVWDAEMCKWASKYFIEGLGLVKRRVEEKGIRCRLITQVNLKNLDFLNPLTFLKIRHLEGLRGNFGIHDERGYMAFILHKENDESLQTYFNNSKSLAEEQLQLFEELWSMATPFSTRKKELEYEDKVDSYKTITGYQNILSEIESLALTCKNDLTILSSNKILCYLLNKGNFLHQLPSILQKAASIKILIEDVDEYLTKQIAYINKSTQIRPIQLGYATKIAEIDEMVMIFDNKHLLQVNYSPDDKLNAIYSNEEHKVLIQELMFEKYWNEIKSLEVMNNN